MCFKKRFGIPFLVSIGILFFSCGGDVPASGVGVVNGSEDSVEKIDSLLKNEVSTISPFYFTKEFTDFIAYVDSSGFNSQDTVRLKRIMGYNSLKQGEIFIQGGRPFYFIPFKKSDFSSCRWCFSLRHDTLGMQQKRLNEKMSKVDSIIGYFSTQTTEKDASGFGIDVACELWKFRTEKDAEESMKVFDEYFHEVFFNTGSVFVRNGKYIYVFTTRSAGYCYGLVKMKDAFIRLTKQPGATKKDVSVNWV